MLWIDKRQRETVAGRTDHDVEFFPASIGKDGCLPFEPRHVARRTNVARVDALTNLGVDNRMRFPEPVVGPRQTVVPRQADLPIDRFETHEPPQPER